MNFSESNNFIRNFLIYWLPLLVYMGLIYFLSSRSSFPVDAPDWLYYADKVVHFGIFGLLTLLALRAYRYGLNKDFTLLSLSGIAGFVSFYGVTDELHQYFVPGRTPSISDWITDTIAAIVICGFVYLLNKRKST